MKILIAGGSGLIGRHLAADLVASGHEVVVLTRGEPRLAEPGSARSERWDGNRVGPWIQELEGVRALVNLAGESIGAGRWDAARKRRILTSRMAPTAALIEGIRMRSDRPEVFVQASAVGLYGSRGDELLDEAATPGGGFLGRVAVEWEEASAAVEALGVRRVVARTGVVLARDGGALPVMARPFRLGAGGELGDGRQWMAWIHLADEIAALRFLIDRTESRGAFNLTAPEPTTNAELSRELARCLRRPNLFRVPASALRLALGEMSELVLGSQRAIPRRLEEAGFRFRFGRLESALADLLP